jgi:DNA primase
MRFSPDFLDEIKARLPVSEVVSRRVQLKKSGREMTGLSPFTKEKTPSFFVNDHKQAWFDFSSGQNGNIFDFLMKTEGLSFPEAVERLAQEAGLQLPTVTEETVQRQRQRASLTDVVEMAAAFFEAELQARGGARARGYLVDRGLTPQVQRQFRIGYAPNERYALRDYLAGKGVTADQMIETGLLIHGEDIPVPYDRFRDRVMFPICDRNGVAIAFGGRALEKDVPAKYLNSPETVLFHKGSLLYNLHNARKAAHDRGTVIAVEGYVDVISMSAAGFPQTVAGLGTALTPDQCGLLWRMAEEPILCFDGDRAGRKAAFRAVETALPLLGPGRSLRFAFLPEGQDPDDLARSGGTAAIETVLGAARPLVDVLWARETEGLPLDTPERRASAERRMMDLVQTIPDEMLRRHYRQEIERRIYAAFGGRASRGPQRGQGQNGPQRGWGGQGGRSGKSGLPGVRPSFITTPVAPSASLTRSALLTPGQASFPPREALLALVAINHPRLASRYSEELAGLDFASRDIARILNALLGALSDPHAETADLKAAIARAGLGAIEARIETTVGNLGLVGVGAGEAEGDAEEVLRQALALHRRARALHKDLKSAEIALGEAATDENLIRLREIQAELAGIDGREAVVEGFGATTGRSHSGL